MIRRIACEQVRRGMYVHKIGGSWFAHPFWRNKLLLTTAAQVEAVRSSGAPWVEIDDELGIGLPAAVQAVPPAPAPDKRSPVSRYASSEPAGYGKPPAENARAAEHKRALALVDRSKQVMKRVFESARLGRAIRTTDVAMVVEDVTVAVTRNPQTLLGVLRLRNKDEYTYYHSVAVCTLMVNCGRHLGLSETQVHELGFAGLMHDIGKMGVPEDVLNKPGRLTDEEFALVRGHPKFGHDLLIEAGGMPEAALDVCLHHHEKVDGTGYPFGLAGDGISVAARLGAICDVYDALTSDRAYKEGWTPAETVAAMWGWEGHFDRKLLFGFMQSVGVFPTGMLVRLRSNRLGMVLENRRRASRPRVLAFYDTLARAFVTPETVTIHDDFAGDQIVSPETPEHWGFGDWPAIEARLLGGANGKAAA